MTAKFHSLDLPARVSPAVRAAARQAIAGHVPGQHCDAWERNNGRLSRCRCTAQFLITYTAAAGCATIRRCEAHKDDLVAKVKAGATFDIVDITELK